VSARAEARILVVDDNAKMARLLGDQLTDAGHRAVTAHGGEEAIAQLRAQPFDVVITDLRMEKVDGFDVLMAARAVDETLPVIMMTAFGAVETAIEAIKAGAFHYITKPFKLDELMVFVERALAERRLRDENRALRKVAVERSSFAQMVGSSDIMRRMYESVERVAQAHATVLIRGESGAGKELVARALHFGGPRRDHPFVAVNCTALPENLLESELFGHVRGAFTGATNMRRGLFVEADQGTLFLDEIGDMPAGLQAKLLRTLEDGEIRSVGADSGRRVDVRVMAATHQDLEARVQEGLFRADLFYRLNVVQIVVPPLRARVDDIPPLIEAFLQKARAKNPTSQVRAFAPEVLQTLARFPWPGNVRELENVVERLVIMSGKEIISMAELELHASHVLADASPLAKAQSQLVPLKQLENDYITWVLGRCNGNKVRAAQILGIDVSTIYRREKERAGSQ
jgi:two-component system, NtrC family, response regulator HydG